MPINCFFEQITKAIIWYRTANDYNILPMCVYLLNIGTVDSFDIKKSSCINNAPLYFLYIYYIVNITILLYYT